MVSVFNCVKSVLSCTHLLTLYLTANNVTVAMGVLTRVLGGVVPCTNVMLTVMIFVKKRVTGFTFRMLNTFVGTLHLGCMRFFSRFFVDNGKGFRTFGTGEAFAGLGWVGGFSFVFWVGVVGSVLFRE